jgi:uroporphyrin-III C-methyltransferase
VVGVGPGGPGHLTAHTVKTIQTATLLLVDAQVTEAVVALATPAARVVRLVQRPAHQATAQAFVEKLIIMAVLEGNSVVHIRVEDPRATNCAVEEITHLQAAGINVRLGEMSVGFLSLKISQNS